MDIDQLNAEFADEAICHRFFESVRWPNGQICPDGAFYECRRCRKTIYGYDKR